MLKNVLPIACKISACHLRWFGSVRFHFKVCLVLQEAARATIGKRLASLARESLGYSAHILVPWRTQRQARQGQEVIPASGRLIPDTSSFPESLLWTAPLRGTGSKKQPLNRPQEWGQPRGWYSYQKLESDGMVSSSILGAEDFGSNQSFLSFLMYVFNGEVSLHFCSNVFHIVFYCAVSLCLWCGCEETGRCVRKVEIWCDDRLSDLSSILDTG